MFLTTTTIWAMFMFNQFLNLFSPTTISSTYPPIPKDPNFEKDTLQLIRANRYPVESHEFVTGDGYILTYYRIPYGIRTKKGRQRNGGPSKARPAVLLQHGLMANSRVWFMQPINSCFPFLLAENGYDVWIGNSRGSKHSQRHVSYSNKDNKYWQFSWEEIGRYDLPASIDYILNLTNQTQLSYVGHSEGSTTYFVFLSLLPEYNSKIKIGINWAPPVYMSNTEGPNKFLATFASKLLVTENGFVMTELGGGQLQPGALVELYFKYRPYACTNDLIAYSMCQNVLAMMNGFNREQLNLTYVPTLRKHYPDPSAVKSVLHYGQLIDSGEFQRFDYGPNRNRIVYKNSHLPPKFNLSQVTAPTALFHSENDSLAHAEDVKKLIKKLGSRVIIYNHKLEDSKFTHIDYVIAKNAPGILYFPTLKVLAKYNK